MITEKGCVPSNFQSVEVLKLGWAPEYGFVHVASPSNPPLQFLKTDVGLSCNPSNV